MSASVRPPLNALVAGAFAVAASVATLGAFELKPHTAASFDRYVRATEARMDAEIAGSSPFLWVDRQPEATRTAMFARLRRGEIVVESLETREGTRRIEVNDGLIHHWIGTVLLPGAPLGKVLTFVQDYSNYSKHFAPTIVRSKLLKQAGDHFDMSARTSTTKVLVTVVIDADYGIDYRRLSPNRVFTRSVATNIMEVANAGGPGERLTPAEKGTGYLWRLNNYCAFEQRPEGTYEQCESISLTRDVPFMLGFMIKPFITGIPRETLEFTLGRVRAGVK